MYKPIMYCATVSAEVTSEDHSEVTKQLNETILPSSHDLEWIPEAEFSNNAALAAIAYTLDGEKHEWAMDNQLYFLDLWSKGEFQKLRDLWTNIPDEVFIGVDTQFKPTGE